MERYLRNLGIFQFRCTILASIVLFICIAMASGVPCVKMGHLDGPFPVTKASSIRPVCTLPNPQCLVYKRSTVSLFWILMTISICLRSKIVHILRGRRYGTHAFCYGLCVHVVSKMALFSFNCYFSSYLGHDHPRVLPKHQIYRHHRCCPKKDGVLARFALLAPKVPRRETCSPCSSANLTEI